MRKIISKSLRKIIILSLFSGLFFVFNFSYNQKGEILARETKKVPEDTLAVCEETEPIDCALCSCKAVCAEEEIDIGQACGCGGGMVGTQTCCCPEFAVENKLEIPIGKTTDEMEAWAKKIIEKADEIIRATQKEMGYAERMVELVQECGADNCEPDCDKTEGLRNPHCVEFCGDGKKECPDNCEPPCTPDFGFPPEVNICCCDIYTHCEGEGNPCKGDPCPPEIGDKLSAIETEADSIGEKTDEMSDLIIEVGKTMGKLTKSRKRLLDCFLRSPTAEEALLKEYSGLMNCEAILKAEIPIHSVLEGKLQKGCYGNKYCQLIGAPEPCAEDYFCCH